MKNEIFLPLTNNEEYYVSNLGNVLKKIESTEKNSPHLFISVKIFYTKSGFNKYSYFSTYKDGIKVHHSLAKAMAELFLKKPKNAKYAYYLDGNNFNSVVGNIRWKIPQIKKRVLN